MSEQSVYQHIIRKLSDLDAKLNALQDDVNEIQELQTRGERY